MHTSEQPVNVVMVIILVAVVCAAVIVRMQPPLMRQLADYLNARSDAEEWFKERHGLYRTERAVREGQQQPEQVQEPRS